MFDRRTAPSAELDVIDAEHVAWIRAQRDPSLWHQATMAAVAWRSDPHGLVPWVLQQPALDRATAGWLFLWPEGSRYLAGGRDFPLDNVPGERRPTDYGLRYTQSAMPSPPGLPSAS